MKARIENNELIVYKALPNILEAGGSLIIGADYLSKEELENLGFFEIVDVQFDSVLEQLGVLYFDEKNKIFTYRIVNIYEGISVEEMKEKTLAILRANTNQKMQAYDWYHLRKIRDNTPIPNEVLDSINRILDFHNLKEIEIVNKSSIREIALIELNSK